MRRRVKLTEGDLRRIVKKSVNRIIRESEFDSSESVWDVLNELEEYMDDMDIIARLISRIGEDRALLILKDINSVESQGFDDEI